MLWVKNEGRKEKPEIEAHINTKKPGISSRGTRGLNIYTNTGESVTSRKEGS